MGLDSHFFVEGEIPLHIQEDLKELLRNYLYESHEDAIQFLYPDPYKQSVLENATYIPLWERYYAPDYRRGNPLYIATVMQFLLIHLPGRRIIYTEDTHVDQKEVTPGTVLDLIYDFCKEGYLTRSGRSASMRDEYSNLLERLRNGIRS